jgi:hypothetical protein
LSQAATCRQSSRPDDIQSNHQRLLVQGVLDVEVLEQNSQERNNKVLQTQVKQAQIDARLMSYGKYLL